MDTVAKLFVCVQFKLVCLIKMSMEMEFSNSIINGTKNGSYAKFVVSSATFISRERIFSSAKGSSVNKMITAVEV
jgi:hypothetical protein